jgi:subtilisin family serine protease
MVRLLLISALFAVAAVPSVAQVALPRVSVPRLDEMLQSATHGVGSSTEEATRLAARLARDRLRFINRLVRQNADIIEQDARGQPARRGELLVMDVDAAELAAAQTAGFTVLETDDLEGLGTAVTRLRIPLGMSVAKAEESLSRLLPRATISADNIYFQSGEANGALFNFAAFAPSAGSGSVPVGMIDGAPGQAVQVSATRGFAKGAPIASNHGSAVASLLISAGAKTVRVADVYGTDKAGGNALAIARGFGWLIGQNTKVITISLVGPKNPLLERAVAAAQRKGAVIVAAVGNDGPAAPPVYPASYDGVIAVTAVDGKRRALIEAGRALHLDYAAPGADIIALDSKGKRIKVRGTSFAAPLVAARAAQVLGADRGWRSALDKEAVDLGKKGNDPTYGRGLVCGLCRGH